MNELIVSPASNGAIVRGATHGNRIAEIAEVSVFTSPDLFATFMRAWFVAHYGEHPVTQLPKLDGR